MDSEFLAQRIVASQHSQQLTLSKVKTCQEWSMSIVFLTRTFYSFVFWTYLHFYRLEGTVQIKREMVSCTFSVFQNWQFTFTCVYECIDDDLLPVQLEAEEGV